MPCHPPALTCTSLFRRRFALLVAMLLLLTAAGCSQKPESATPGSGAAPQKNTTITLCHGSVTDILPRIAIEQGLFAKEGLTVELKDLSDGKQAFDGLLSGECTFAINGSPPIVLHDPKQANYTILATVMSDDDSAKLIVRRDHGISTPQGIKGKRIAVKKGIVGNLFLDLFMMRHGIKQDEISTVFMEPDKFQAALVSGEIDGFAMTNKMINNAAKALGDKALIFAEPGINIIYGILTTRTDLPPSLAATTPLLKALLQAEAFVKNNPQAAKALLAKAYTFSAQELEDIWSRTTIEVALANTLFASLEDLYTWQVERGFSSAFANQPNYLAIVSPAYLSALKPKAVSVVKK